MPAAQLDLYIEQFADFDFEAAITDDADQPVDLTGSSFVVQLRANPNAPVLYQPTVSFLANVVKFTIPAEASAGFQVTQAVWDMLWIRPGPHRVRLYEGSVTISKGVSRVG